MNLDLSIPGKEVIMRSNFINYRYLTMNAILCIVWLLSLNGIVLGAQNRAEVLKQSSIVFVGTVTQVHATSFADVAPSSRTIVVRVDEVLEKPESVALGAADKVTVEVKDPAPFLEGVQATFYTNGWIFGNGLAVREVDHELATARFEADTLNSKAKELSDIRMQLNEADLIERIETADMVVLGRIIEVRPSTIATAAGTQSKPITEHDPDWHEAIIKVESQIKGALNEHEIVIRFPNSLDMAWSDVPKFKKDQQGIFILNKDQVSGIPKVVFHGSQVEVYTALNSNDVLPKEAEQRVRALAEH